MRYLSVCSGIEAATRAWHPLGWKPAAFAEIDGFASAVLTKHYPDVDNLGDFTKIDVASLGRIDLLVGGTPCQDFSSQGKMAGLAGKHGNLTLKFADLVDELEEKAGLRYVVWENVPRILSLEGNPFGHFLGRLLGANGPVRCPSREGRWPRAGVASGPGRSLVWRVLSAQYFGVPQRRDRVFLVAGIGAMVEDIRGILLEPAGDREPVGETRERRRQDLVSRYLAERWSYVDLGGDGVGSGPEVRESDPPAWAFNAQGHVSHVAHAILAKDGAKTDVGVIQDGLPRKYLAVERERLMGFPDRYTDVLFGDEPATHNDRTFALGNSMVVPVMRWIGERLRATDDRRREGAKDVPEAGTLPPLDDAPVKSLEFLIAPRLHRLLYALLLLPGQEWTLADLFRVGGAGRGGTQELVTMLGPTGLLLERREGRKRLLRADPDHPLARPLRELLVSARCATAGCGCSVPGERECKAA